MIRLLEAGPAVNAKASNQATTLILATVNGRAEVLQTLLAAQADVNATQDDGDTALMHASATGYADIVRALFGTESVSVR